MVSVSPPRLAHRTAQVRVGLCQFNQRNGARNGLTVFCTCANDLVKLFAGGFGAASIAHNFQRNLRRASEALKVVMRFLLSMSQLKAVSQSLTSFLTGTGNRLCDDYRPATARSDLWVGLRLAPHHQ